jgi:hypothetical protein
VYVRFILGYVLLPNHFRLVLWLRGDGDLRRWMQWLLTAYLRLEKRAERALLS